METAGKHVCPQTLSLTGRFGEPQGNHKGNNSEAWGYGKNRGIAFLE